MFITILTFLLPLFFYKLISYIIFFCCFNIIILWPDAPNEYYSIFFNFSIKKKCYHCHEITFFFHSFLYDILYLLPLCNILFVIFLTVAFWFMSIIRALTLLIKQLKSEYRTRYIYFLKNVGPLTWFRDKESWISDNTVYFQVFWVA